MHEAGAIPANLGIACDNYGDLLKKLTAGLRADALVTAAGVSVGDRDFVREMLAELETNEIFWKVSAMITFEEMVRPALLKMMGHQKVFRPLVNAILREDVVNKSGRVFFSRVRLERVNGRFLAWNAGNQETGFVQTLLHAYALAVLPADRVLFEAGEEINVHILSSRLE